MITGKEATKIMLEAQEKISVESGFLKAERMKLINQLIAENACKGFFEAVSDDLSVNEVNWLRQLGFRVAFIDRTNDWKISWPCSLVQRPPPKR